MAQLTFPLTKPGLVVPVWLGLSGATMKALLAAGQQPVRDHRSAQTVRTWLTLPDLLVTELMITLPDADVLIGLDVPLKIKLLLDGPARSFTLDF